jgi:hypothetical protein
MEKKAFNRRLRMHHSFSRHLFLLYMGWIISLGASMRATLLTLFATTALFTGTAFAGSPPIPSQALNPTANVPNQALSVDNRLGNDNRLDNDADTLAGVEGPPVSPSQAKVNSDHNAIDRLNQQLDHDTTFRASHTVLHNDETAISDATKQLGLDQKACAAELKASGAKIDPQLASTTCR